MWGWGGRWVRRGHRREDPVLRRESEAPGWVERETRGSSRPNLREGKLWGRKKKNGSVRQGRDNKVGCRKVAYSQERRCSVQLKS